ncbi:MAG: hypothetical protein ACRETM_05860 [Stenotrophobium sp.]
MIRKTLMAVGIAALAGAPAYAAEPAPAASSSAELQQIQQQMRQLKAQYEQQIQSLEQRLQKVETAEQAPPPPPAPAASAGNAFNPKISLVMDGSYAHYSNHTPAVVPGYQIGDDADQRREGFSLGETELAVESNVDDQFHGWAALAVEPQGGISVEEAFVNTTALPDGFAVKMGRFFSAIGYQNSQHAHVWDFADAPLVYRAMLGNQFADDGVQLRWVAPTDVLLEFGSELYHGGVFPGGGDHSNIGSYTVFSHLGSDIGDSGSWRIGLSQLRSTPHDRSDGATAPTEFTGKSALTILDGVYKWAPEGNTTVTNFVAQAEFFYRNEGGMMQYDPSGANDLSQYSGHQRGFYVQGVYQFMPRWRVGLRYDRLSSDNTLGNAVAGTPLATLADNSSAPQRWSLMTDFSNSEFSRLRLQYNRDESRPGEAPDNQVFLQYIFSLGSHPAHQF